MKFSILAAIVLLIGCTKQTNSNQDNNLRSLPSIHTVIQGVEYTFSAPTSYEPMDSMTYCHYVSGDLRIKLTIGLDGRLFDLPNGMLKGADFVIYTVPGVDPTIVFTSQGTIYPVIWEMVP